LILNIQFFSIFQNLFNWPSSEIPFILFIYFRQTDRLTRFVKAHQLNIWNILPILFLITNSVTCISKTISWFQLLNLAPSLSLKLDLIFCISDFDLTCRMPIHWVSITYLQIFILSILCCALSNFGILNFNYSFFPFIVTWIKIFITLIWCLLIVQLLLKVIKKLNLLFFFFCFYCFWWAVSRLLFQNRKNFFCFLFFNLLRHLLLSADLVLLRQIFLLDIILIQFFLIN